MVLRRQLSAALRLADRWAELYPYNARMLILVTDGTEADRTVTPTTVVIDPHGAGMSAPLSSLLRLLHPASAAAMVFGPWAMAAALGHAEQATTDGVAVLIDVNASFDHALPSGRGGWAALCRHSPVVTADGCFVAAQRRSLLEWQRRTVWSAPALDFGIAPDAGTWWGTDRGMSNVQMYRALIDRDGALVVPSPDPRAECSSSVSAGDDDAWWAQRDGVAVPLILRTLTITHLGAYLEVAEPQLSPYAPSTQRSLEQVPRDLLSGSPRDLRLRGTASTAHVAPAPPPNPFGPDPDGYRTWLAEPVTGGPLPVSRALAEIHRRRPDLHEAFADLETVWARRGLLEWAAHLGVEDGRLPTWLIPAAVPTSATLDLVQPTPALTRGVLVVGYLDAALGLGEAGRLMVRAVERAGERVATRTYRHLISASVPWRERPPGPGPMDVTIICLNGSELPRFIRSAGSWPSNTYTVGLWFWEAERLTANMLPGFDVLDEIWVTSEYTAQAVRADAPPGMAVYVMPLGTDVPDLNASRSSAWAALGLPAGWLAGFSFDHGSMSVRKNPLGLVAAWCRAFAQPTIGADAPHLVVKTMNGAGHPESAQAIHDAVAQRPDITVIDTTYSPAQQHQFVVALDCYASLHRSEGYGLLMLEAMAVGTPVVATGATGNLAFMTADNSWLVPATPIRLDHDAGPYPAGSVVHEPDLAAAAALLVDLYAERSPNVTAGRVERARADVRSLADGSAAANWVQRRLADIRSAR